MAKFKKKVLTPEERVVNPQSYVRKLTNMLKSLKEMSAMGPYCQRDLNEAAHKIRVIRAIYKAKIENELDKEERAS